MHKKKIRNIFEKELFLTGLRRNNKSTEGCEQNLNLEKLP